MTPQEMAEYKQRWLGKNPYMVQLHSDLDIEGKEWCRRMLERHQWSFESFTDVYEHTFYFEDRHIGQQFEHEFIDWVNR